MPTARRDPRWDNAKFLLILLVVFGHAVEKATDYFLLDRSLFIFIYSFHMPAFLFISGLFAKRTVQADKYNWRKLVPYLLITVVLSFYRDLSLHARNPDHAFSLYNQNKISWFMLALFASYSIAWLLRKVPPKVVLPASVVIGLAVGYVPFISEGFTLSRIIVFFPFFYAGYALDRNTFANVLDKKGMPFLGAGILAAWLTVCIVFEPQVYLLRRLFTGQNNYDEIPAVLGPAEFLYRALTYVITAVVIFGFFTLVPRTHVKGMTKYGARTLSVYFWHLPFLDIFTHMDAIRGMMKMSLLLQLVILTVLSVSITYLFCWEPLTRPVNAMLNPWPWLDKLRKKKTTE